MFCDRRDVGKVIQVCRLLHSENTKEIIDWFLIFRVSVFSWLWTSA